MSEKPPVPAALQTLLLICETDQQREELTHCYYATLGGDPSSPILQLATLISAVAVAGRKNNANGELAAHLADLKNGFLDKVLIKLRAHFGRSFEHGLTGFREHPPWPHIPGARRASIQIGKHDPLERAGSSRRSARGRLCYLRRW
jgi:hypothetical protein